MKGRNRVNGLTHSQEIINSFFVPPASNDEQIPLQKKAQGILPYVPLKIHSENGPSP